MNLLQSIDKKRVFRRGYAYHCHQWRSWCSWPWRLPLSRELQKDVGDSSLQILLESTVVPTQVKLDEVARSKFDRSTRHVSQGFLYSSIVGRWGGKQRRTECNIATGRAKRLATTAAKKAAVKLEVARRYEQMMAVVDAGGVLPTSGVLPAAGGVLPVDGSKKRKAVDASESRRSLRKRT
jgi:hypothetical protein